MAWRFSEVPFTIDKNRLWLIFKYLTNSFKRGLVNQGFIISNETKHSKQKTLPRKKYKRSLKSGERKNMILRY